MRAVVDARGREVALPDRVERVVSLVPSLTEWLVVAGAGERLVGVTAWCTEPAAVVARLPKVRGTKNPDLDAVSALQPDLVVANAEENRRVDVERLEAAGIAVVVTRPTTVAGAIAELRLLAEAVGGLAGATALDADLARALAAAYRRPPTARARYACAIWRDPWMWVGRRTYAADLLRLCGGEPVFDDPATRYPRAAPEQIAALGPQVVLLPSEPYAFERHDADEVAAWAPAARLCDGRLLTWYGPRIPAALDAYRALFAGLAAG